MVLDVVSVPMFDRVCARLNVKWFELQADSHSNAHFTPWQLYILFAM